MTPETSSGAAEDLRLQRILGDVTAVFLDYVGADELEPLRRVVDLIVRGLGDWCAFSLVDADGLLRPAFAYHPDPRQRELADRVFRLLPPQSWDAGDPATNPLVLGRPVLVEPITDEMLRAGLPSSEAYDLYRQIELRSVLVAPMRSGGEPIGALTLALTGAPDARFPPGALHFAEAVASRASLAVRNARLTRDLSTRRDEATRRAAELEAVLASHPAGVALWDADDCLRFVSPRLSGLFGTDATGLVGRHVDEVLASYEDGVPPPVAMLRDILNDRALEQVDDLELRGNRVIQRRSAPVRGPDGAYLGRVFLFEDVTAARTLDRQRREFLSVASHELRTPLTSISLHLQTAMRRLRAGGVLDEAAVGRALRQTQRLGELIDEMLNLSRLESGRFDLVRSRFDVSAFVAETVGDLAPAGHQNVVLSTAGPVFVDADRSRLGQVLANLLQNAFKYSPPGATVNVDVSRTPDGVVMSVADQGIGIPIEDQERLFEPFFRARNASTSSFGGLGLGLYISAEIVRRHGGRFEVLSGEGKGSTFRVHLPSVP